MNPVPATMRKLHKINGLVYSKPFFMPNILDTTYLVPGILTLAGCILSYKMFITF